MKNIVALFTALAISLIGCLHSDKSEQIDAAALHKIISTKKVQLVDVRTAEEYATGHIEYAVNIDMKQPNFIQQAKEQLDKRKPVYLYCRSGRRSSTAAKMLVAEGFHTINLQGGIEAWKQAKLPIVK